MPTLKIDGREVTVERGTTILEAAQKLGIDVPTFCYHPGLSRPANCRMCLVEVEKAPKPVPACYGEVADGMVVDTKGPSVQKTRKAVLEFILLNHPVDCPICDQAGECVLQDHYFKYSATPSRLTHRKVRKPKVKRLGPDVVLDAERCILCTRCIRFCDEVAKESQLEIVNRGEHSEITTFPGEQLDNPYAGNTVDICPVGALTSVDFRFRTRVWFLQSAESVCTECARGCRIRVDTFENVPRRFKPLHNPKVNGHWMCDEGRFSYKRWTEDRMEGPLVESGGRRGVASVPEALEAASEALLALRSKDRLAVVLSPSFTNEDAFLVGSLLRGPLAGANVFLGGRAEGDGDDVLRRPDKNPNTRGTRLVLETLGVPFEPLDRFPGPGPGIVPDVVPDVVIVFGDEHALSEAQLAAVGRARSRIVLGRFLGPLWKAATVFLPVRTPLEKEGTFTNFDGVVQRIDPAVKPAGTCKSDGWYAMKLAAALGETFPWTTPAQVFGALVEKVPGFAGMSWDALRPHGLRLGEVSEPPPAPSPPSNDPAPPPLPGA